jgi:hypothetical protein
LSLNEKTAGGNTMKKYILTGLVTVSATATVYAKSLA